MHECIDGHTDSHTDSVAKTSGQDFRSSASWKIYSEQ